MREEGCRLPSLREMRTGRLIVTGAGIAKHRYIVPRHGRDGQKWDPYQVKEVDFLVIAWTSPRDRWILSSVPSAAS